MAAVRRNVLVLTTGLLAACAAFVLALGVSPAAEPPAPRVARLVERLGSSGYEERAEAFRELEHLGPAARREVEQALRSPDAEIRLRAAELLRQIKLAEVWQPSLYRGAHRQEPAAKALAALAKATGNTLTLGDAVEPLADVPVDYDGAETPFWQAADRMLRSSGNHIRPTSPPHAAGLTAVRGRMSRGPVAYAGPLRCEITAARRIFIEDLDFDEFEPGKPRGEVMQSFQFGLDCLWEDRLHLVACQPQPRLIEAVTDTGDRLPAAGPAPEGWNCVPRNLRQLSAALKLTPPSIRAKKLARLTLAWEMIAVGDFADLRIDDLAASRTHRQNGIDVCVEQSEALGSDWELTLTIARDLGTPEPQEILYHENEFVLTDGQGRRFTLRETSGTLHEKGARVMLRFIRPAPEAEPRSLVVRYPQLRAQRAMELNFTDVPLPHARPE